MAQFFIAEMVIFAVMKRRGVSYQKRVADVNRIYDTHVKEGLSNREIWRRYVYPIWGISERTFYNLLKAVSDPKNELPEPVQLQIQWELPS